MKKYFNYQVRKEAIAQKLITMETLDISEGFSYPAEAHEFYEFAYVDSGMLLCKTEQETIALQQWPVS